MNSQKKKNPRVIARYDGERPGPLLVVFGAMHGNEPAGVQAIDLLGKMLEVEPITNTRFTYAGTFLGLIGNRKAYARKKRFIKRDLNRLWTPDNVRLARSGSEEDLPPELLEIKEVLETIQEEIDRVKPKKLIILDLHTTSSFGGIFTIPSEDPESMEIALELHAPVIKGMLKGLQGTTLHYFNSKHMGLDTTTVTFESGQHDEKLSVNRAIAAITNCMRSIGAVRAEDVENRHDIILLEHSRELPKVVRLVDHYGIQEGDKFTMKEGFVNFQRVEKGEVLATTKSGEITASQDALILMPLYQKQGEDGYFLVEKVEGY